MTLFSGVALLALAACEGFDPDLRSPNNGFTTSEAAREITGQRPRPDSRGVISYPDYQVVVARSGDTVATVANRVGMSDSELARFNALTPETTLRSGEVLALPRGSGATGTSASGGDIEISTLADSAISRAETGTGQGSSPRPAATTQPAEAQPTRHVVQRGETAFIIARLYNVTPRALADWNGLDPEMRVREGQTLLIPVGQQQTQQAAAAPRPEPTTTPPGSTSPAPPPPSASTPLPAPVPSADQARAEAQAATPPAPDLSQERTEASRTTFVMPVDGRIIRAYAPGRNEGIGIAASAGANVRAAAAGTVAAITRTTGNVNIVVVRHDGGLLTVYANIDNLTVAKDARVSQGQNIGKVAAGDPSFVHFEVRRGQESVDPMRYLQ
ncbi:peptidoglycan DD-metalloendopeptidase family protein [Roseinatronobacter alkalisoli]|uniref:Peptidoglycan DD-metalloendopeptidase family protein n=1 Tax=Roseinatronobacter alkalisoli TaxID=3028235 RepID=A0ABT5T692_9RHOB|nr:peptidoglycan DD-metalloendopeptidase family protein [Roseinatronobacter sp. HJB301]MDD7970235.1 peptidoglycan DD-metalloendopeptidase family protein [Roseinatronobacter sp. HJB301]